MTDGPVDAVSLYGDDPSVILAGLTDGAQHATCESCRDVMRRAHDLIEQLLLGSDRGLQS